MIAKELLEYLKEERIQIQFHYVEKTNAFKLAFRKQFSINKVAYTTISKDYYVPADDILVDDEEWAMRMEQIAANFVQFIDAHEPDTHIVYATKEESYDQT